jgi:hypothetical protein
MTNVGQKLLIERDSEYVASTSELVTRYYAAQDAENSVTSTFLAPYAGLPNGMIMERYVYGENKGVRTLCFIGNNTNKGS